MILLITVVVALFIRYFFSQWKYYKSSWTLEGPIALPIIGNGLMLNDMDRVFGSFTRLRRNFKKPLVRMWLGIQYFIYTDDPQVSEAILNNPHCLDKGRSYRFLSTSLGDGLVTLNGDVWKIHRKLLNPSFQYNIINSFMTIFNQNTKNLLKRLHQFKEGEVFDAFDVLKHYSMEMICETTMDLPGNEKSNYLEAAHKTIEVTVKRMFQAWYQPHLIYRFSSLYEPNERNLKTVFTTIENLIEEKKSAAAENPSDTTKISNIFLDRILKLEDENLLNHTEVVNEVNTILMAGYETTATSASFVLLVLAMHPEYQEQLFEEIKSVFPDRDSIITQEHLKHLSFLDLIMKETLRVFPSVPFLTRLATKDIMLNNTVIPAGTEFLIDIYQMHRNKKHTLIENPNEFNPLNFLPETVEGRHPYSYIPFSSGQRNCIGMRYGQIVTKMVVIEVLRQFRICTKLKMKNLRFRMHITLQLINKHLISLQRREVY